jgi:hypothetical protein
MINKKKNNNGLIKFFPNKIENSPNHIKISSNNSNILNRTIYAHGYPRSVETGFLDKIISTMGNFDISIHIEPYDIETMMVFLNRELQKQRADLYSAKNKNILNPSLQIKYKDTKSVLANLQKGKDKLFNVSLYFNCRSKTKEELDILTKLIQAELNALLIIPRSPNFRMMQGFQSSSPLAINNLKQIRSVPTEALSAFFPFTSSFLQADKTGIWLGQNKNNIPIIKDIFNLTNPNGLCLASSGSGKSYMAKLMISRYLLSGTDVMVIDPQGEYKALIKRFDGQLIELSPVSKTIINPLDLMGHDYPEKRLALLDLMPLMLGELSDPQKAILERALTDTYEERGIYSDDVSTWKNSPPILEDLYNVLRKIEKKAILSEKQTIRSLISRLEWYVNGVFSFLNQETEINFNNQFVCFDIGNLPKQVKPVMMFLILDHIYMKMKKDLKRKLLVIDESWSLLKQAKDASYIFEIVKTCRKFNLALFLINQEVEGMLDSEAGKSALANSSYTLLMRQKPAVINNIKRTFFLSETEANHLLTAGTGEGILVMDDDHSEIRIVASPEEHKIITTRPDELIESSKKISNKKRLAKIQKSIDEQKEKRAQRADSKINITKHELCIKIKDLNGKEIAYLQKQGYKKYFMKSITSSSKEEYLIKRRKTESPQHIFMIKDIVNYLKNFTDKISNYETVKPDIVFEINRKEYAIEVETGKILTKNKKQLMQKVNSLNDNYENRWFFVVTDKNLTAQYNKFGKTYDKRYLASVINRLVNKKPVVQPTGS